MNSFAFSKPQSVHMIASDFKDEIEYVENILHPYAAKNKVSIQVEFTNTLKKKYDENQIRQCFINLIKNSIEAMKEDGGIVSIESRNKKVTSNSSSRIVEMA